VAPICAFVFVVANFFVGQQSFLFVLPFLDLVGCFFFYSIWLGFINKKNWMMGAYHVQFKGKYFCSIWFLPFFLLETFDLQCKAYPRLARLVAFSQILEYIYIYIYIYTPIMFIMFVISSKCIFFSLFILSLPKIKVLP
jgi:hypothetical protein